MMRFVFKVLKYINNVFALATITVTLIIFFRWDDKCLRRKHLTANKKSTQNRLIKDVKDINFWNLV